MSNPKKQHYVPQVYLKNFSFSDKEPYKIYALCKKENRIFPVNVSDTSVEHNFYTVNKRSDPYIVETTYATVIEPMLARVITKIRKSCENILIQNHTCVLNPKDKIDMAYSMIFQLFRGKITREYTRKQYLSLAPVVAGEVKEVFNPISEQQEIILNEITTSEDYYKLIATSTALNYEKVKSITEELLKRHFVIFKICGNSEFITSDNPVTFMDAETLDVTPFRNGLATPKTIVYFPITPKLLLAAYHPNYYFNTFSKYDCRLEYIDSDKEFNFINTYNYKQVESSYAYVYSRNEETLKNIIASKWR